MIVNIAFNTIIYIMVFLFPGVIFRRLYFSGNIKNKFDSGSNFERVLWSILLSLICLFTFCFFTIIFDDYSDNFISKHIIIGERDVLCFFEDIYSNHYPDLMRSRNNLKVVFLIFSTLYFVSAFLGWFSNRTVHVLKLHKIFSFLQFSNQWESLVESNKLNNSKHKYGDRARTHVDLKTKNGSLFSGIFKQYIINEQSSVESIVLNETYKYYTLNIPEDDIKIQQVRDEINAGSLSKLLHLENNVVYIYKKRIEGELFVIGKDQVEDISIRFVTWKNVFDQKTDFAKIILSFLVFIITIVSAINVFFDLGFYDFKSIFRRIVFFITVILNLMFILMIIVSSLDTENGENQETQNTQETAEDDKKEDNISIKESILWLIYFTIPYLYVFNYLKFWIVFGGMLFILPGIAVISMKLTKKNK